MELGLEIGGTLTLSLSWCSCRKRHFPQGRWPWFENRMKSRGILQGTCGDFGSVVSLETLSPPFSLVPNKQWSPSVLLVRKRRWRGSG